MANDEERARNTWTFGDASIVLVENTADLVDLEPILLAIQPEFRDVTIRRRVAGTMASGLYPEVAVTLVLGLAARGFLTEMGKDAYRAFRQALFHAYRKTRTSANHRGYRKFAIEVNDGGTPSLIFALGDEMHDEDFEQAVLSIVESLDLARGTEAKRYVWLEFNRTTESWEVSDSY